MNVWRGCIRIWPKQSFGSTYVISPQTKAFLQRGQEQQTSQCLAFVCNSVHKSLREETEKKKKSVKQPLIHTIYIYIYIPLTPHPFFQNFTWHNEHQHPATTNPLSLLGLQIRRVLPCLRTKKKGRNCSALSPSLLFQKNLQIVFVWKRMFKSLEENWRVTEYQLLEVQNEASVVGVV